MGVRYAAIHVPEIRPGSRFTDEHVKEREARALRERLKRDDTKGLQIALHEKGEFLSSRQFAGTLEGWSTLPLTFVIGGPLGLHDDFLRAVDRRLSLSPMTLPHELVRVLFVEQLYRALTILRRIPYHK
jgi:23S rRNA (pseudouridine1915-N3)-methyltransferase